MKKNRYIVAGGRDFSDYERLKQICDKNIKDKENSEIVCGCAKGADSLGKQWALENNVTVVEFPADWETYGKAAGHIRNKQMSEYATHLIAFWDGKSKGTQNMIKLAKEKNLKVGVINYEKDKV